MLLGQTQQELQGHVKSASGHKVVWKVECGRGAMKTCCRLTDSSSSPGPKEMLKPGGRAGRACFFTCALRIGKVKEENWGSRLGKVGLVPPSNGRAVGGQTGKRT